MDEVIDPAMTVKVTGRYNRQCRNNGLKLDLFYNNRYIYYFIQQTKRRDFHTVVRAKNRIGPHNNDVLSVIIGSLLGDCYGSRRNIEGTRFVFKQSIIHKKYLFWLYNFFFSRGYCSNLEPRLYNRKIKNDKGAKIYNGYVFNTYTFRSFDWIYEMFYKNGRKIINSNIKLYLTPLALAIWISDDGCWVKSGVRIACNSYYLEEVKLLVYILNENFNLICTIQKLSNKDKYSIYIKKESIPLLRNIVSPYLHCTMSYKIGL